MIRLERMPEPDFMSGSKIQALRDELLEFLRQPEGYRRHRRVPIDEDFFFSPDLTNLVAKRSHMKCAFCESAGHELLVDHFRPINVVAENYESQSTISYYNWLAYEWDNLLSVCAACVHYKNNRFPIAGQRAPYMAQIDQANSLERMLLINPILSRPEQDFLFLTNGWCKPLTGKGKLTVSLLNLNRDSLVNERRQDFRRFQEQLGQWTRKEGQSLVEICNPRKPFAGVRLIWLMRIVARLRTVDTSRILRKLPKKIEDYYQNRERGDFLISLKWLVKADDLDHGENSADVSIPNFHEDGVEADNSNKMVSIVDISEIFLSNFKGIEDVKIKINSRMESSRGAPCLMLLGENACGKSSILQAIALALIGHSEAKKLKLKYDEFLRNHNGFGKDDYALRDAEIIIKYRFGRGAAEFEIESATKEVVGFIDNQPLVIGYGPRRFFYPKKSLRADNAWVRVRSLFNPIAVIPDPGIWLNSLDGPKFDAVVRAMREIMLLNDNDDVVRKGHQICVLVEGEVIPLNRMSDGYKAMFTLATDIFRELLTRYRDLEEAHAIVIIDEIETHLHPRWKMQVMRALRRALPRVQFIVTTHDPLCLRGMENGEVVVLQKDAEGRVVALENLPDIKGMRAEQILTSDYFGLSSTVDPETELAMARYADGVAAGRPLDPEVTRAVSQLALGNSAEEQVMQKALTQFIQSREDGGTLRTDASATAVQAVLDVLNERLPQRPERPAG